MADKPETWTVLNVLEWTKGYLAEKGVDNARLEAEWLLCAITGLDRMGLYLNFDKPLMDTELAAYRGLVTRRAKREPLQYILGTQEFMGLEFEVAPGVLIPRYDTEVLVEAALKCAGDAKKVLDIGLGSGCIAIALAKKLTEAEVWGVEQSRQALDLSRRNAERNGAAIKIAEGSLFAPVSGGQFDLIVSNPPYIPSADINTLQPEVRDYEPREALDGGEDGLDFYRQIVPLASDYLNPGGWLLVEIGIGQSASVRGMFAESGFSDLFVTKDAASIERVVGGRLMK
jgi:release factor glutamine methyltransferase